jgi:hypothetical protein
LVKEDLIDKWDSKKKKVLHEISPFKRIIWNFSQDKEAEYYIFIRLTRLQSPSHFKSRGFKR